ncbi:hypothetical protein ACFC34_40995 [Streptomyces sp. NPDC056053]|uniref:hypothetical protein n=1 Tax=Streptomyces sp. NPDC056053 TaxID=3345696 RepID=UPI0035D94A65
MPGSPRTSSRRTPAWTPLGHAPYSITRWTASPRFRWCYGLPNVLPAGVIDWQHHGLVPLGYDVPPALEIIAFKGGNKGYIASPAQRHHYLTALDDTSLTTTGQSVSQHLGVYLLVKALFFLALMRPTDSSRTDKHLKWQYRRHLFTKGLEQYEHTGTVDTALFPGLEEFAAGHHAGNHP